MAKPYIWKSPALLGRILAVTIAIEAALNLILALLSLAFGQAFVYRADDIDLTAMQALHAFLDLGRLILFANIVLATFWLWRISANAQTFGRRLENSTRWAPFWYLVPIVSWFKPYQVMEEIWRVSGGERSALLFVWWISFVTWNILSVAGGILGDVPLLASLVSLIWGVSSICYVMIILKLIRLQTTMHETAVFSDADAPRMQQAVLDFSG